MTLSSSAALDVEPISVVTELPSFARLKQVIRNERTPADLSETREVLGELARRKSGALPAQWLVEQVLRVTEGTDWPSRRAALDAVLRRLSFAARDELSVVQRPDGGMPFGAYALERRRASGKARGRAERRPYQTHVYALAPLHASCDCADFLRASLGLCKHVLAALEDIAKRFKGRPLPEPPSGRRQTAPRLGWDPVRSWTGPGDRLAGLRLEETSAERASSSARRGKARSLQTIRAAFEQGRPKRAVLLAPERRMGLLRALQAANEALVVQAEPAALAVLGEELSRLERRQAGRAVASSAPRFLKTLERELYPYQREGISRFLEEGRLLLADDMGLGKTTQAVAACHVLFESRRVERGLLIVPAALKAQWSREWQATTARVPLIVVEGRADERARLYRQTKRGVLITNYEQLLRDFPEVQRFEPELVVLDEAQRIKNWASKSSAYVTSLDPEWRLVLTGTPMENRMEELATLLDWIDDTALAPKWRLTPWHTTWGTQGANERVGARHLDTLRDRLACCMLRRTRRDVLSQLPPRSDVRVPVEMTSLQREEHDALAVPIAQLMQAGRRRPLRQPEFLKLMQLLAQQRIVSNGMALLGFDQVWPVYSRATADEALLAGISSPKLGELRRILRELALEQGRKVVVFSQWRKMLRLAEWAVRPLLEAEGLGSVFFTGAERQELRTKNVVDFHDDPTLRVMFLTDAGGVGLNLQRAASACINLELPWNPAVLEQRIGRIYRLGQASPIDVVNLVSEYGIEARIAGLVGSKKALFDGLFDGTTDAVSFGGASSFLRDVERLVEPVTVPELPPEDMESGANERSMDLSEASFHDGDGGADSELARPDVSPNGAASESPSAPRAVTGNATVAPSPSAERSAALDVAALMAGLRVTHEDDGGLRIDAPPAVAQQLSQLLEGLAGLLRSAASRGNGAALDCPPSRGV